MINKVSVFTALAGAALALSACADVEAPSWATGEPEKAELAVPRKVSDPTGRNDRSWPNLASVPDRPVDFPPAKEIKRRMDEMSADKAEGLDILNQALESGEVRSEEE